MNTRWFTLSWLFSYSFYLLDFLKINIMRIMHDKKIVAKGYLLGICPFLHYQRLFYLSTDPVFNVHALSKQFNYVLSYIRHLPALSAHVMENKIKSSYVVCPSHNQISVSFPVSLTTVSPRSNLSLVSQLPLQHPFYLSGNTNSLVLFHVTWQFFLFKTSGHHLFLVFSD